jgi:pimeloyl-ACP methyl ester carboxylesterase
MIAAWKVDRDLEDDQPVRAIASLHVPVLLIQGGADTIALARDDGQALDAAYPDADYWLVPSAAHVTAHTVAQVEYESRVAAFLHESLT